MKDFKKIAGVNLGVLVIYNIWVRMSSHNHDWSGIMLTLCILIIFQVTINGIISLVYYGTNNNKVGNSYMLSAALVAIIGFAACTAIR